MRSSFPNRPFFSPTIATTPIIASAPVDASAPVTCAPAMVNPTKPAPADYVNPTKSAPDYAAQIIDASSNRRIDAMNVLDIERFYRDWTQEASLEQAARAEHDNNAVDQYDAAAKVDRGQGNRKFIIHFAIGACATMATLVLFDAIVASARTA